jgi:hypothetical protein
MLVCLMMVGCTSLIKAENPDEHDSGDWTFDTGYSADSGWTAPEGDTHLFIRGCVISDVLSDSFDCSLMTQFVFKEEIDDYPGLNLAYPMMNRWEETNSGGVMVHYAELVDGDANLSSFSALWGWYENYTTGHEAFVFNEYLNQGMMTYRSFSDGGTTACVANLEGGFVSMACEQFNTQVCNESWEAAVPGLSCDAVNQYPAGPLADDHPYFHGDNTE